MAVDPVARGEGDLGIGVVLSVENTVLNKAHFMQLYCKKKKKLYVIYTYKLIYKYVTLYNV